MTTDPQPKGRSGAWRLANFSAAIAGSGVLALTSWFELLAPVALVIAGFIFVATGKPAAIEWSAFKAAGAVSAGALLFIVLLWTAFISVPAWMGWRYDIPDSAVSYSAVALAIGPIGALIVAVMTGFLMGGIGGLIAEATRDGAVCRAIQRARE